MTYFDHFCAQIIQSIANSLYGYMQYIYVYLASLHSTTSFMLRVMISFLFLLEKRKRHELFVLQGMEAWNFKTAVACSTW